MGILRGLIDGLLGKQRPASPLVTEQEVAGADSITISVEVVPPTPEQEASWERKRQATALSRAGDTGGAVAALDDALKLEGEPQTHDEIRRAKYLQKDGRTAEAWAIYVRLLNESTSAWVDVDVLDAMRLHLQRDDQAERAIDFGIAHRLARVNLYRDMKREAEEALSGPMPAQLRELAKDPDDLWASDLWKRQKEQHRSSIEFADKWINDLTDPVDLADTITKLAKKAKALDRVPALMEAITTSITSGKSARSYLPDNDRADG